MKATKDPSSDRGASLPKDAAEFVKKMGIDTNGLEVEMKDIWKMLNEMSSKNPLEYQQFVDEQIKSFKEADEAEKTGENSKMRHFRPNSGFVFCADTFGGDGVKVCDAASSGKTLYINICSHDSIEIPKDAKGKAVVKNLASTPGLEIPLLISPVRDIDDHASLAVDIVMHESVVIACSTNFRFKCDVCQLALDSVSMETKIKAGGLRTYDETSYKGGRGDDGLTPVLFPLVIEKDGTVRTLRSDQISSVGLNDFLQDPGKLLVKKKEAESFCSKTADVPLSLNLSGSTDKSKGSQICMPTSESVKISPNISKESESVSLIQEVVHVKTSAAKGASGVFQILSKSIPGIDITAKYEEDKNFVVIVICGLPEEYFSTIALLASEFSIIIKLTEKETEHIKIEAKDEFKFVKDQIEAKLSKKLGTFTISCGVQKQ